MNKESRTVYVLSDSTATKWIKENPELWVPMNVGVQKGAPARKVTEEVAEQYTEQNNKAKEEVANEDKPKPKEEPKPINYEEMTNPELKALAERLGATVKGRPNKDTLIKMIKEKLGE